MSERRPNFLLFITDQMRADHMGCDGNAVIQTPNLDRLAAEGAHFTRAYVNCPLCMPSRATLFTGLTPRGHRVRTNGVTLDARVPTVGGALHESGYRTTSVGKIHLSCGARRDYAPDGLPIETHPEQHSLWADGRITDVKPPYYGFHDLDMTIGHGPWVLGHYGVWLRREHPEQLERLRNTRPTPSPLGAEECGTFPLEEEFHHTRWVADRTIRRLRGVRRDEPFFLVCSFPDPHHPYVAPRPWDRMYDPADVPPPVSRDGEMEALPPHMRTILTQRVPTSGRSAPTMMPIEQRCEIIANTYGMVSLIDHHIGRVMEALQASGTADDTIVIFISDHGDLMGDHNLANKGPFHFEGLLRVPMIWWNPKRIAPQRTDALASLLDLAPTVMDFADVAIPAGPDANEAPQQPPAWPGRSLTPVLTGGASTVQDSVIVENDEDYLGLRLRTLVTSDYKITTYTGHRGPEPYGELFDLNGDPHELHNRWDDPGYADVKKDLIVQLHYRQTETDIAVPRRLAHA